MTLLSAKTRLMRCAIAGMTQAEAAAEMGCDRSNICRLSSKYEIKLASASPTVQSWPAIRALAERGLNRNEIAEQLSIARHKVDYFAKQNPDVAITPIRRRNCEIAPKRVDYTRGMSDQQREDYRLLLREGGMSAEEARASVLRPRKRLAAVPKSMRARTPMTVLERVREGARA